MSYGSPALVINGKVMAVVVFPPGRGQNWLKEASAATEAKSH